VCDEVVAFAFVVTTQVFDGVAAEFEVLPGDGHSFLIELFGHEGSVAQGGSTKDKADKKFLGGK